MGKDDTPRQYTSMFSLRIKKNTIIIARKLPLVHILFSFHKIQHLFNAYKHIINMVTENVYRGVLVVGLKISTF